MLDLVLLDVNETLFALDAVDVAFTEVGLDPTDRPLWFARILRDGFAVAAMGDDVAFPDLARHHAQVLGDAARGSLRDDQVDRIVAAFDEVEAHADVATALRNLAGADVRLVAYTNGSATIAADFLQRAGLDDVVEAALDVSEAGHWKPHPDAYRWACDHLGVASGDTAMLAVHPWDVAGAMRVGLLGAWLDRSQARWPSWLPSPDRRGDSMIELAHVLANG